MQKWLRRLDSNQQLPDPESGALPFGHSPANRYRTTKVKIENEKGKQAFHIFAFMIQTFIYFDPGTHFAESRVKTAAGNVSSATVDVNCFDGTGRES